MKLIHYLANVFGVDGAGNSRCIFAAGEYHPPHADSPRHVLQEVAEEVDVTLTAEEADQLADKALAKAVLAVAAADEAEATAKAAAAAALLPVEPAEPITPAAAAEKPADLLS